MQVHCRLATQERAVRRSRTCLAATASVWPRRTAEDIEDFVEGEFDEADLEVIRDVVTRLGLADVAAFGLIPPFLALFVVTAIF